jgi:hypothetical protein
VFHFPNVPKNPEHPLKYWTQEKSAPWPRQSSEPGVLFCPGNDGGKEFWGDLEIFIDIPSTEE